MGAFHVPGLHGGTSEQSFPGSETECDWSFEGRSQDFLNMIKFAVSQSNACRTHSSTLDQPFGISFTYDYENWS